MQESIVDYLTHNYKEEFDFGPACKLIGESKRILIAGHVSPDGDTIGSSLALGQALRQLGKDVTVVFQDEAPDYLQFLPGYELIVRPEDLAFAPDLLILVDCATLERTGDGWLEPYLQTAPLLIFDHHALRDENIKAVSLVEPRLAATAELIYWFLEALGAEIDLDTARCLYTALCTDTGGFRFTNTKVHTFRIAAELLAKGINLEEMRVQLFESRSLAHIKLMGAALTNMQSAEDNKLVWTSLDSETKARLGALPGDTDSIAGQTMLAAGVKIGVFFNEKAEEGVVKISFRGRNGYNVGKLAAQFGGGGHYAASGCSIAGSLGEVMPRVLEAALEALREEEAARCRS